jgi:hypothetical protein
MEVPEEGLKDSEKAGRRKDGANWLMMGMSSSKGIFFLTIAATGELNGLAELPPMTFLFPASCQFDSEAADVEHQLLKREVT